ncbi:MAG: phospholipid carrier-dependent glycosyltransferase [Rhodococcus sp. (in: high G+C Gram-positive bacteria)]
MRGWITTAVLTIAAAITRFTMLGYPTDAGTPVFDEKHYAPQGYQVLTGGTAVEDNPAYGLVVHPPVGKQLLALGEAVFGYTGWGWRLSSAVFGVILVLLVVRIVRRMTRSTLLGAVAGVLLIADGVTFVTSRVGMLDIFMVVFVVAAFGALIRDRDDVRERMHRVAVEGRAEVGSWGPRLGVRWWRFGAGVLLGLACGTKWSGLYFVAFFGLMSVAFDVAARRQYGIPRPWMGTAVRDVGPALYALVAIPIGVYLATYAGWFASETAVDRHAVGTDVGYGGSFSFVPDALRSLWYYSGNVLDFHSGLTNSAGNLHPWESKPWTWPMGLRPMLYYFADGEQITGCGSGGNCVKAVMLIGTPAMWWLAFPMLGWALWSTVARKDWRYGAVLVGYGAGIVPWFLSLDRQMYFFYASALAPFLIMGLTLVIGDILGRAGRRDRRTAGLLVATVYIAVVVANFVWLWPILTGVPITQETWQQQLWLPSWR